MKKGLLIVVIALFCCGFIPQHRASRQQAPQKSVSELYTEAIKSITIYQDTLKTLHALRKLLDQDSTFAPAMNLYSRIANKPETAVRYAEAAYLSDTTNNHYLEDYARALITASKYDRAIPVFQKMVRHSTDPNHFNILALLLDDKNRYSEAVAVVDSAEVRFGRISELSRLRQYCLLKLGKTLEAEADARKAVEEAPYVVQNHLTLAKLYALTKRDSLAIRSYMNAIQLDSLMVGPWMELYEYSEKTGRKEACLVVLEELFKNKNYPLNEKIEMWDKWSHDHKSYGDYYYRYDKLAKSLFIHNPEDRRVVRLYSVHLYVSGQHEESLQVLKRFLKQQQSPVVEDFTNIIYLESGLNKMDSVAYYANLALKHHPKNTQLLQLRSYAAQEHKKYDEAISYMNEALKYAEDDKSRSEMWSSIGILESQRGEHKLCIKAYKKALKYNADNSGALNNLAYEYSLEGRNLEEALTMVNRALELSQNNPTTLDTKAWVLYKLGRYAEAKKVMQQAISLDRSKSPEYPLHYGDILYALGEEFMAKTYWRKALERGADKEEIEKRFLNGNKKR